MTFRFKQSAKYAWHYVHLAPIVHHVKVVQVVKDNHRLEEVALVPARQATTAIYHLKLNVQVWSFYVS